ncbi:MAG TPA: ABC transporter permease [Nitrososphaerales archaeon]|nr:ABC transporter permease [Nitrososphaerales archaeon]
MSFAFETWVLFVRSIKKLIRTPILLFFALFQPIIFLVLFTQLFGSFGSLLSQKAGYVGVSYLSFATAGIVLQNGFSSALQSGTSVVDDLTSGFLEKVLVTPVNRAAILLGRLLSDAFRVVVQSAIILALAYLLGADMATGAVGVLLIFLIIAFFGLAWSGISLAIGLKTKSSETVFGLGGIVTFPLLFMSTALVPTSLMPSWMQTVSNFNPITYAVNAVRALTITGFDWGTVLEAFGVIGLIAVVTLGATLYLFRKVVS